MLGWFSAVDITELGVLLGAVFAAFATIVGVLLRYMESREKASSVERQNDTKTNNEALKLLSVQIEANTRQGQEQTKAMREVARETRKAASEAKERNGHLGEQNIQITEMIAAMGNEIIDRSDRNLKAVQNVHTQRVVRQEIEKSTVKDEHVEHKE